MKRILFFLFSLLAFSVQAQEIPLPEYPRPDFERDNWVNLNGYWQLKFDKNNVGIDQDWQNKTNTYDEKILVPFPWGSKLSEVEDKADIAWYTRKISVPAGWKNKNTHLTIGASDWETSVWLDGHFLGSHRGGYTPFSFDLTPFLKYGQEQDLVVRVDDTRRMFTLYGKQGYGNARGIWQTIYMEAVGKTEIDYAHFIPNIDKNELKVELNLKGDLSKSTDFKIDIAEQGSHSFKIPAGQDKFEAIVTLKNPTLWNLDKPYLYTVQMQANDDAVKSYFGFREISTGLLPGTEIPYVTINKKPVYLQLTLDQSYHPEGFYTFPSDEFMKNEILLAKGIGLNGIRTHIKVDIPRKLYWADKLGVLVMSDLPNSWGEPDEKMQEAAEYTLREMIKRDFNHPAIFSWIVFNETWGLRTAVKNPETGKEENKYLPKTQLWVASMYYLAKSLDQTRLVEDNSICCGAGHTETDLYSWHQYLPGYKWENFMANLTENNYPGSTFDFEKGFAQGKQPMLNSECGNVWGYQGSTGDVDWSYDYHRMMNVFRKYPKMSGWLYTEHHDVINEWNGYWRFDRSKKYTGLDELVQGMKDNDFHSLIYLSTGQDITEKVKAGSLATVPLFLSSMTDEQIPGNTLSLEYSLRGLTSLGEEWQSETYSRSINYKPWMQEQLESLQVPMPDKDGLFVLSLILKDQNGKVHHHNFHSFIVDGSKLPGNVEVLSVAPDAFTAADWSSKNWLAMEGKKADGAGKGQFTYTFSKPTKKAKSGYLLLELGAKELFAKDKTVDQLADKDYMLGARAEPSQNKNAYPMTDETLFPSEVSILINGQSVKNVKLADDPADHRGILSWFYQKEDDHLDEAGSYGYLVKVPLSKSQIKSLQKQGQLNVKLQVKGNGGLAVYGKESGRYAFDPSLILSSK
ncbi:glycoside hydrolase family 2 [Marinilongibacter aquaticus]|uniref:glycoside hydrolase family 2 protein n=1 Tax=Marinilongibacter aquaticus TaxID=2975157 RepID=UPI0021BDEB7F|nr:sugar-binding domain-containing protein [Marinilongibacter aquaticus]UBM59027.1 glycoside hydrolase family 2 [Marinilongibacter aquaticus]